MPHWLFVFLKEFEVLLYKDINLLEGLVSCWVFTLCRVSPKLRPWERSTMVQASVNGLLRNVDVCRATLWRVHSQTREYWLWNSP